ncbi:hypothetical protein AAG570_001222 [Ranatra chinensis]|uniref:Uncharacterized protein n=1 Tax=Ranatra chinensis TaxID=642074 RepID=A0ABD0YXP7_9HEMI
MFYENKKQETREIEGFRNVDITTLEIPQISLSRSLSLLGISNNTPGRIVAPGLLAHVVPYAEKQDRSNYWKVENDLIDALEEAALRWYSPAGDLMGALLTGRPVFSVEYDNGFEDFGNGPTTPSEAVTPVHEVFNEGSTPGYDPVVTPTPPTRQQPLVRAFYPRPNYIDGANDVDQSDEGLYIATATTPSPIHNFILLRGR